MSDRIKRNSGNTARGMKRPDMRGKEVKKRNGERERRDVKSSGHPCMWEMIGDIQQGQQQYSGHLLLHKHKADRATKQLSSGPEVFNTLKNSRTLQHRATLHLSWEPQPRRQRNRPRNCRTTVDQNHVTSWTTWRGFGQQFLRQSMNKNRWNN